MHSQGLARHHVWQGNAEKSEGSTSRCSKNQIHMRSVSKSRPHKKNFSQQPSLMQEKHPYRETNINALRAGTKIQGNKHKRTACRHQNTRKHAGRAEEGSNCPLSVKSRWVAPTNADHSLDIRPLPATLTLAQTPPTPTLPREWQRIDRLHWGT